MPKIYHVSLKGKRTSNQDTHIVFENIDGKHIKYAKINCYGIFDGHGYNGKLISSFLGKNLPKFFTNKSVFYPINKNYVENAFKHISGLLTKTHKHLSVKSGSTSLVVCHYYDDTQECLDIFNTGDCRCIISKNDIGYAMTEDHKPSTSTEMKRIRDMGGEPVFDGYDWRIGDLSVSRAFGDTENKFITYLPDIFHYNIKKTDKFIVLGCDGLWDVMKPNDVVAFINQCYNENRNVKNNTIASQLAEHAIELGSTDNISVIVVIFDK